MNPVRCFLLEPTGTAYRWLRRYESGDCPLQAGVDPKYRYHCSMTRIEDGEAGGPSRPDPPEYPPEYPRWPAACGCGQPFSAAAERQLFHVTAYRDAAGDLWSIHCSELPGVRRAPAGAMWFADWMPHTKGPDGRCLVVRCPANPDGSGVSDWMVDGPSLTNPAPAWSRTGTPPLVTASPSIFVSPPHGFHGWLRDGFLVGC